MNFAWPSRYFYSIQTGCAAGFERLLVASAAGEIRWSEKTGRQKCSVLLGFR